MTHCCCLSVPLGDFDRTLSLNLEDLDELTGQSALGMNTPVFDLNGDTFVNEIDVKIWVKDLKNSWVGDANLDLEFNSADFLQVFKAGTYEQDESAVWSEGDWNGDGFFDTTDLVAAFVDGGYELGPRPAEANAATVAVPEPSAMVLLLLGLIALRRSARRSFQDAIVT